MAYLGLLVSAYFQQTYPFKNERLCLEVPIALGSPLLTIIVSWQTGVADGLTALGLLIALQYTVARLSTRWTWFKELIKSEPSQLFYQGWFLKQAMRRQRVIEGEIRSANMGHLSQVEAVILETDGSFSVVTMSEAAGSSS